jgi:dipeptidase D
MGANRVWHYFYEIIRIPRPSKHEEKILLYLEEFAKNQNFTFKKDAAGNLIIYKPASSGYEGKPVVILQSHVDMVCEKNSDIHHDFFKDPIIAYTSEDWIKAKGTTLGADDGIGMAIMLAVLADKTLKHGPIECLFTVDEETGLTGAFGLEPNMLTGKYLINLDSEDEGEIFIGCAGGKDTIASFPVKLINVRPNRKAFVLGVTGLKGGHSGDDIHKGFGNAIKIMAEFLLRLDNKFDIEVYRFEGGNLRNAIPRESFASITIDINTSQSFIEYIEEYKNALKERWKETDPGIKLTFDAIPVPNYCLDIQLKKTLIETLNICPSGVISWSKDMEGLVETSTNLASIKFINGQNIVITTSQRSSSDDAKNQLSEKIADLFTAHGACVTQSKGYPGWTPNIHSNLLKVAENTYNSLYGSKPLVKAIHAGLECGLFLEKYPHLDMISIGPTIKGAHSPDERLHIPSVQKTWDWVLEILKVM